MPIMDRVLLGLISLAICSMSHGNENIWAPKSLCSHVAGIMVCEETSILWVALLSPLVASGPIYLLDGEVKPLYHYIFLYKTLSFSTLVSVSNGFYR